MGVITTSLVVDFGTEDDGILTAEIDGRDDGYNGGDTSFVPGEQPAFLIYSTSNVTVNTPEPSLGSVQKIAGPQSLATEEFITFADEKSSTSSLPIYSGFTYKWIGNNLGTPTVLNQKDIILPAKGVGVLKIEYTTQFVPWRLTNIPTSVNGETSFPVIIFISGTTT